MNKKLLSGVAFISTVLLCWSYGVMWERGDNGGWAIYTALFVLWNFFTVIENAKGE